MNLSEFGIGVSLLTDSKYGYACHRNIMRLSLLRSPKRPDPNADIGNHSLVYSIYPHFGSLESSNTIPESYFLNSPIILKSCSGLNAKSFFQVDEHNIIIDTVKVSEDNNNVVIVRLFEAHGGETKFTFKSLFCIHEAYTCDLLERNICVVDVLDKFSIELVIHPYQILSLKLYLN
jgi:alpha-mannosidase